MTFVAPGSSRRWAWAAACCLLLSACAEDGSDGDDGAAGPPGPPGVGVTLEADSLAFTVDGITITSPPVVEFTLTNQGGVRFAGLAQGQIRFTLAKLVPAAGGNPAYWQNYINRTETKGAGAWGAGGTAIQGNSESNGTLVNHLDGTYTYTFATDVTAVTSPIAVSWQPALTHRLGVQISGGANPVPVTNATYDWRPSDGATSGIERLDVVQTASCNECHSKLALHSGGRVETKYCVTCHNPGSVDANSGNVVDFKVMIHKIHRGEFLPSVEAGGEYAIWGFGDAKHDYSHVALPQDIRNCTKCHDEADAATPQAGLWSTQYSVEACGSCHDDVDFTTGAGHTSGEIVAQNGECTICHGAGFAASAVEAHLIPDKVAAVNYALNLISVANTAPGQFPVITYEVTNPTAGNSRYNVMSGTDPAWTNGSVSILLGWNTGDHTNLGNGSATTPASAISLNGRAASSGNNAAPTANPDGTFTVTSLRAVPASLTGSGVAGMTTRVGADHDGDGSFTDRVPVKSVVKYFAITDAAPVARRSVVDIVNNCDDCHDQLTLHGESRTDEPQLCVICHNPRNTDISRRPKNGDGTVNIAATVDGRKEQSIDMKRMVHSIHAAAKRENPYVVYGFGGSVNDFSGVGFPGLLNNCRACHKGDTFTLPLASTALASSIDTGNILANPGYLADQTDDQVISPTAAVCSACHDSGVAQTHMEQNGGQFSILVTNVNNNAETCEVCHGPGRIADVTEVHSLTP
ncbi:MAG: OmcA/MtrC family decaheme c-type cytochrome [Gammaproteobacteria bacterium]